MPHPSDWRPDWSGPLQSLQDELTRVLGQFRAPRTVEPTARTGRRAWTWSSWPASSGSGSIFRVYWRARST